VGGMLGVVRFIVTLDSLFTSPNDIYSVDFRDVAHSNLLKFENVFHLHIPFVSGMLSRSLSHPLHAKLHRYVVLHPKYQIAKVITKNTNSKIRT
jgi:hypothetical protein